MIWGHNTSVIITFWFLGQCLFVIGPEGAHINISGISGLAAKTSYAKFLIKAIQDSYLSREDVEDDSVAFLLFNVKGKDLMGIHLPNDFAEPGRTPEQVAKEKTETLALYTGMGLTQEPFQQVKYFMPNGADGKKAQYTHLLAEEFQAYVDEGRAAQFTFTYREDKEDLDLFFANVDDTNQTIDAIQEYIIAGQGGFNLVNNWKGFHDCVGKHCDPKESPDTKKEIPVVSWRKFRRIITQHIKGSPLFQSDENKLNPDKIG
ncbi:hypothetical protein SAMN05660649_00759 [Desulfotomaculum arcticum]|uniref:Uncharacterized protein n=1 Tax=Desulfotruncus arcticus DSM 17038 TaxID=1121424 RepID=A0A1I2PDZ6_9FIRM|nr:hypothetical protein SAMN05660649_00759 [Desulfotomaculum arcticum] [Desulfotruncus arcticus DSM 17038]